MSEIPPAALSDADYRFFLRHDLSTFLQRVFREVHPETPFLPAPYLELLTAKLMECRAGSIRRLIINLPPRHTKSIVTSVAFPAWLLGHDPSLKIICVSYGQELSEPFARQCRGVMTSDWYQAVFATRLARTAVHDFTTTRNGGRLSSSVGGALTGRGADVIIIDDPLKPGEAVSEAQRTAVNSWYDNTLLSRLNNPGTGVIIVVTQRLHTDDLVGHLEAKGTRWEVLSLPALAEVDEAIPFESFLGPQMFRRHAGEALHPERVSSDELEQIRLTIGSYHFVSQYQQSPQPREGNHLKRAWLTNYEPAEATAPFPQIIQSWDTANKTGDLNDYSVCTTWGVRNRRYYLLDVFRRKLEFPDLKRAVIELASRFRPTAILIEDKASGTQLIQELKIDCPFSVIGIKVPPGSDKELRLYGLTAAFKSGRVLLPAAASWLDDYVAELTGFPGARHDDQVDSTTQALAHLEAAPLPIIFTDAFMRSAGIMPSRYGLPPRGWRP